MIVAAPSECSPNFAQHNSSYFTWKLGLINRSFGLFTPRPRRGIGLARRDQKQRLWRGASLNLRGAPFAKLHSFSCPQPFQLPFLLMFFSSFNSALNLQQ